MSRILIVAIALTPGPACRVSRARESARVVERARVSMGSELRLTAWTSTEASAVTAFEAVFAKFDRLESLMSVWREGSDVVRLNAAAGDHPVPVSVETREVLNAAREVSDWTDGKFDVTFGALSDLWKFDHDQDNSIPDPAAVRARLPLIDYRFVEVDDRAGTAFVTRRGARVHLGGIGKGYAIDRAIALLRSKGLTDFMIQAGGDLYVSGRKGDRPWRLGIADPRGASAGSFATIELSNSTLTTSGDYERFFLEDGRRYHHLLDPDTGMPATRCRSVTIITHSALLADGLSTGVFILGPQEGMALIERLENVEGVIVTSTNDVLISSGLKGRLEGLHPPTDAP
ncbi:MAG: FAD:protein FMN transferase [Vicinamibacterales bacterium]